MSGPSIILDPPPKQMTLPDALGSAAARPLAEQLIALRGAPLTVCAGSVRKMGAQCVQVLLSAAVTWRADGFSLGIENPSPEFEEALRLLGLSVETVTAPADAGGDSPK